MSAPKVSIIVPCLNAEKTLQACIKSVLEQSWSNWELIVQDGGSTDGSLRFPILAEERIQVFREKDHGIYDAMNLALSRATGEWIYFLGADDALAHSTVLAQVLALAEDRVDIIYGHVRNVGADHKSIPELHRSTFSGGLKWRNTLHHQGAFYHKRCFKNEAYDPSFKILGDYELNLRLFKMGAHTKALDEVVAVCQAQGLSKRFTKALYEEERRLKKKHLGFPNYYLAAALSWLKYWIKG